MQLDRAVLAHAVDELLHRLVRVDALHQRVLVRDDTVLLRGGVDLRDEALAHVGQHLRDQLARVGDERAVAPLQEVVVDLRGRGGIHMPEAGRQLLVELARADEEGVVRADQRRVVAHKRDALERLVRREVGHERLDVLDRLERRAQALAHHPLEARRDVDSIGPHVDARLGGEQVVVRHLRILLAERHAPRLGGRVGLAVGAEGLDLVAHDLAAAADQPALPLRELDELDLALALVGHRAVQHHAVDRARQARGLRNHRAVRLPEELSPLVRADRLARGLEALEGSRQLAARHARRQEDD